MSEDAKGKGQGAPPSNETEDEIELLTLEERYRRDTPQDAQKFFEAMRPARDAFYARIRDLDENAFFEETLTEPLNDFADLVHWYGHAVHNYAMPPATPAHRERRPRMIAIARILKATLFAHVGDRDDIIKELEDVAGRHLRKSRLDPGADSHEPSAELFGGNVKDEMLRWVNMLLELCAAEGSKGPLKKQASEIASSFLANYGMSIVEWLPPEVPLRDPQTQRRAAEAIEKALRTIRMEKWASEDLDTAEKVVRGVLYALGHKSARGFFDYRQARAKPKKRRAK